MRFTGGVTLQVLVLPGDESFPWFAFRTLSLSGQFTHPAVDSSWDSVCRGAMQPIPRWRPQRFENIHGGAGRTFSGAGRRWEAAAGGCPRGGSFSPEPAAGLFAVGPRAPAAGRRGRGGVANSPGGPP